MSMREKIARAVEAADCHSVGFVDRATDAVLAIIKEYGEERVEAMARALCDAPGPRIWREVARAAINAFLSEAEKP